MTRRYVVQGRVQGVGFRYFVHRNAARLGVAGHARNLPDGSVEVVGSGKPEALLELETLLRRGPSMAEVTSVTVEDQAEQGRVSDGFRIL